MKWVGFLVVRLDFEIESGEFGGLYEEEGI